MNKFIEFIEYICSLNANFEDIVSSYTAELRQDLSTTDNNRQKTRYIFKYLMRSFSLQGISDRVAIGYQDEHGNISYFQINNKINKYYKNERVCRKLRDFYSFTECGYKKSTQTCNNQLLFKKCPVPSHNLRNGRLNQTAYSLYLFIRDVCNNDIINFINDIIYNKLSDEYTYQDIVSARNKLLSEFTKIFGVGNKVASMTLSELLLSDFRKRKWNSVGRSMVAVDRLIHNFLDRTGLLMHYKATHNYGKKCDTICTNIIMDIASKIDAKKINKNFPSFYPRFVQYSIFNYCAADGLNICNKNSVGNSGKCHQSSCFYYKRCARNKH